MSVTVGASAVGQHDVVVGVVVSSVDVAVVVVAMLRSDPVMLQDLLTLVASVRVVLESTCSYHRHHRRRRPYSVAEASHPSETTRRRRRRMGHPHCDPTETARSRPSGSADYPASEIGVHSVSATVVAYRSVDVAALAAVRNVAVRRPAQVAFEVSKRPHRIHHRMQRKKPGHCCYHSREKSHALASSAYLMRRRVGD